MIRAEIEAIDKSKYEYASEKDNESEDECENVKEKEEVDKEKENKDDNCEDPENSLRLTKKQIICDENYYFKI